MKRVQEIKVAREGRFWENRMKGNKAATKANDLRELKTGIDLVKSPLTRSKAAENVEATTKVATRTTRASAAKSAKKGKDTKMK
jgi:hypothetical protein